MAFLGFKNHSSILSKKSNAITTQESIELYDKASNTDTESNTIILTACGDILLARGPGHRIEQFGSTFLFNGVKEILKNSDLAFANLESPASQNGKPYPGKPANVTFRSSPEALAGIAWAGFDVVSLANNHMYDYGPEALVDTLMHLDNLGIKRAGAGIDLDEARKAAVLTVKNQSIAFLAYAEPIWSAHGAKVNPVSSKSSKVEAETYDPLLLKKLNDQVKNPYPYAGIAHTSKIDLVTDINKVKHRYNPDYIIISVHWGEEHHHYPNKAQVDFGRLAIDAGANIVLGHHPHVLQGVEKYKDGLIIYSMGNFIFDMIAESTYSTAAFHIKLSEGKILSLNVEPVMIARGNYSPSIATGKQKEKIIDKMIVWSKKSGTNLTKTDASAVLFF